MDSVTLENSWNGITYTGNSTFEFKRIDSGCIPELNIGFNSAQNRCLILELPKNTKFDFQSKIKENLSFEFFKDTNYIVIQLTDNSFYDLFNDFIISLYHKIKAIDKVEEYSKEFIQTFYKWGEFFNDNKSERLSIEIIKGLFGELIVLKSLIINSNPSKINDVLESWKGPYEKGHDFELDSYDIEVKTKDATKLDIKISSEYQLEKGLDKSIELAVISVENDPVNGVSLREIIMEIKNSIIEKQGDCSILLKALNQKGLTLKNIQYYDNYRFKLISKILYDCDSEEFPKLIKSKLLKEINTVNYNIRISSLNEFIISKEEY